MVRYRTDNSSFSSGNQGDTFDWWAIVGLTQAMFRESQAEAVIQIFLNRLPSVLPVSFCGVGLRPNRRGEHWWAAGYREGRSLSARLLDRLVDLCRKELATELFSPSAPVLHVPNTLLVEPSQYDVLEFHSGPILATAIKTERTDLGILLIGKGADGLFSEDEHLCCHLLTHQLAYALESAALYTDTLDRDREIALIYQTGQRITQLLDLSELMSQLVVAVSETFGYESVTLLLIDEVTNELVVKATHGLRKDKHLGFRIPITDALEGGIVGWVAHHAKPYLAKDVRQEKRYLQTVEETRSELCVPIKIKRRVIGVLDVQSTTVGGVTENDCSILETLADQVAIALENARLYKDLAGAHAEIQQTAKQLQRLLERTVLIQEQERHRIAADIHDHVSQLLYAAVYEAEGALESLPHDVEAVEGNLLNIQTSLNRAISEMRKTIFNLWPTSLDEMGLLPSTQLYLSKFEKVSGVSCELEIQGEPIKFSPLARINLYRILQEALHNVQKHAAAICVKVTFSFSPSTVRVCIRDNGGGFNYNHLDKEADGHLGLISMRERARSIGGRLRIQTKENEGTTLIFEFPVASVGEGL